MSGICFVFVCLRCRMRLALVSAAVIVGVSSSTPSSATVDWLTEALTVDETAYFQQWARESLDLEIQASVLERLVESTRFSDAELLAYVRSRHPLHFETLRSMGARRARALWIAYQPVWFHEALYNSPIPISPPSQELVNMLEGLRPQEVPAHLKTRHGLARTAHLWNQLCVAPLKAYTGSGHVPCASRTVELHGRSSTWFVLPGATIRELLVSALQSARANLLV